MKPLEQLIEQLQTSDASMRGQIAQATVEQLICNVVQEVRWHGYRRIREIPVAALKPLTNPAAVDALIDALAAFLQARRGQPVEWPEEDPYEEGPPLPDTEGEAAVEALRALGTPRVIPHLVNAIQQQHYNVAEAAKEALKVLGSERD